MHIPPSYVTAGSATPASAHTSSIILLNGLSWFSKETGDGDSGGGGGIRYPENWSSLIGIVTAIVGNVLISFALNMQRYAHIRLDREWQEKERQRKRRNASGLSLNRLNEEVTKFGGRGKDQHGNGMADQTHAPDANFFEATESDPLVANSHSQTRPGVERGDSAGSGPDEEVYKQKSYLKSPYWWFGIILMTVGEAGNFLAYGFAPASIVSPLGVVALISNCIIAPFMLKEPFRKRDALGVIIAVGGAVTVVLSANDNNPKLGPGEIWDLIRRWEFETYLGITVGVIIVLMGASNKYGDKNILIDLGLVGLFGKFWEFSVHVYNAVADFIKVDTLRSQPKVLRHCFHIRYGGPLLFQSSIYWLLFSLVLQSCRSSMSIVHCSASMPPRSFPSSLFSSLCRLLAGRQCSTATLKGLQRRMQESLSVDVP